MAPLKAVSIPRLELMAAIIGVRLAASIGQTLEIPSNKWVFWSDAMDVLHWIRGRSRTFKPFVSNRVGEIQNITEPAQWRYVPTGDNPADLVSRGMAVTSLAISDKWWTGATFLYLSPNEWPENKIDVMSPGSEIRKQCLNEREIVGDTTFVTMSNTETDNKLDPTRYSSWTKLTRVCALVMRFVDNCRLPSTLRRHGPITPDEIMDVESHFIKVAQSECFVNELKSLRSGKVVKSDSKLLPLNPIIDDDGILRSDGRLQYAACLPWEARYPIILPRNHRVTTRIIKDAHEKCHHGGTNHVLSKLSSRYWIQSAREAIRDWERQCMWCRRRKAQPATQIMAPLPELRTRLSLRAFSHCAVDFAGPFITKQGRGKARLKRYLCLFTCLTTRAVHLELAYGLTTDAFLNAFYRMASRRGMPQVMLSDNGTNFVGGHNELSDLVAKLNKSAVQDSTANDGVKWQFNPPLAPHFSGVHEIMIKAAKKAIKSILGEADITDEELLSAVVGAEGLINSRPLTYQSANASDIVPLTPNHFLFGQMGGQFAPDSVDSTEFSPRKRWRRVQELVHHFWGCWMREWLPGLHARKKWRTEKRDLQVDDIVLCCIPILPERGGQLEESYKHSREEMAM